jgi:hypothetical protein
MVYEKPREFLHFCSDTLLYFLQGDRLHHRHHIATNIYLYIYPIDWHGNVTFGFSMYIRIIGDSFYDRVDMKDSLKPLLWSSMKQ